MQTEIAAQGFAALGSEARLEVVTALVRAGQGGLTVGDIQVRTGIAPSTLAHHLRFLTAADLVEQTREGRTVRNRARFDRLEALARFVLNECCVEDTARTEETTDV
ncbi:metalloregulator ArsR/SmtB family transcription factor [Roseobacter sp. HKCCA0434]|uniref:ArsR/SmtB family transcription factor n=1 Tax=Roseobacter sp. HKCCA0434 TaxID=3079297 RepID=UPI002905842D|nr:metalloregulator ArsR/SmtB family transcription factor [Roseobacter sp. HKCCA0434]